MKNIHLLMLLVLGTYSTEAQSDCIDAYGNLNNAYANVKDAYESNNISHLKYFSERSLELFQTVQSELKGCDCRDAYELALDVSEILKKVEPTDTYENGRYFVKRARELGSETITALDICTVNGMDATEESWSDLENEQLKLAEQQEEIARKETELNRLMDERKTNEAKMKKEILVKKNEAAISLSIKSYNDILAACDCDAIVENEKYNTEALLSKELDVIKHKYLTLNQSITLTYLAELKKCGSK